jgi:hypothetical protein
MITTQSCRITAALSRKWTKHDGRAGRLPRPRIVAGAA